MGRNWGLCTFGEGELGGQGRGLPACQVSSWILIRPTVWPQCTNVTDRQRDRQRSDSIGRTVLQTVAQKLIPAIKAIFKLIVLRIFFMSCVEAMIVEASWQLLVPKSDYAFIASLPALIFDISLLLLFCLEAGFFLTIWKCACVWISLAVRFLCAHRFFSLCCRKFCEQLVCVEWDVQLPSYLLIYWGL